MSNTPRGYILIDLSNLDAEFDIDQFLNQNLIKIDADVVAINTELGNKLPYSLFSAANDFIVGTGIGTAVKRTVAEVKSILGLGSAAYTSSGDYATSTQGTKADNAMPNGGGTFTGALVHGRNEVQQPKLKDYSEVLSTIAASTGAVTINLANGNVFDVTLTGTTTFTFLNPAASGQSHSFTMILRQGGTVQSVTWPSSVKWPGDTIPTISDINKTVILTFVTLNGGTRWYGMAATKFTT